MKIQKNIQRRIVFLFAFTALCLLLPILHYTIQLCNLDQNRGNENMRFIGMIDSHGAYTIPNEAYEPYIVPIQKDENGDVVVVGVPADLLVYSPNPDYELPEHYGWKLNEIHIYVAYLFMFIVVGLIISILVGVIRGLRTGNIFRRNYVGQLRWLAVVSFIFILLMDNRNVFHQVAIQQCYNETSPITLNGQIEISPLTLLAPLLLFIFAEVMAIAAKMNEDESMTI
ncbi:MAG: DUF2975 domain-containing protein [Alistipes sp.]|nr:DUF2975 domain-containing protein [Alistipes sp.]